MSAGNTLGLEISNALLGRFGFKCGDRIAWIGDAPVEEGAPQGVIIAAVEIGEKLKWVEAVIDWDTGFVDTESVFVSLPDPYLKKIEAT